MIPQHLETPQHPTQGALLTLAASLLLGIAFATPAQAQNARFAAEISGGRNIGMTPYRKNVPMFGRDARLDDPLRPYLVNELAGAGSRGQLTFLLSQIEVTLFAGTYAREEIRPQMSGDRSLPSSRQRPDRSIDDSGVQYSPFEGPTEPRAVTNARLRSSLLIYGITGGYRFFVLRGLFNVYLPVSGGIINASISDLQGTSCPNFLFLSGCGGFILRAGVGLHVDISEAIDLLIDTRLQGLAAFTPIHPGDTPRSQEGSPSTEAALFSTLLSTTITFGLQLKIQ